MDITARSRELDAVRQRRAELSDTLHVLSACVADAPSRPAVVWGERMHDALLRLASDFELHIEVTEGEEGLHQAILAGDLRLANQVAALSDEHPALATGIAELVALTEPPVTAAAVAEVAARTTALTDRLHRHRKRGADLIWEAYATDLGGCD